MSRVSSRENEALFTSEKFKPYTSKPAPKQPKPLAPAAIVAITAIFII